MANLNSTTLAKSIGTQDTLIPLTSVANITRGDVLFVDQEAMPIKSLITTTSPPQAVVSRTGRSALHGIGATVYTGSPALFYTSDPVGAAPAGQQYYWINTKTGVIWVAQGDEVGPGSATRYWVQQVNVPSIGAFGVRVFTPTPTQ